MIVSFYFFVVLVRIINMTLHRVALLYVDLSLVKCMNGYDVTLFITLHEKLGTCKHWDCITVLNHKFMSLIDVGRFFVPSSVPRNP